ncbi:outer membrane beta-barrel protein [Helicobacter sp. 13S00477-4]|uniref:outer membrane beta-barrel protein n=1 Tax=Helicobacter sp. 13S00477-4 TaxID=1905759 RepID=UPI000BA73DA9|nr:outer membrane beta-barrel protein [Helicobacter sp. 13S00477-4]PAF50486.1 hypothetical protein BKH44_07995 [Helicobacter sp. 13S00477-4]
MKTSKLIAISQRFFISIALISFVNALQADDKSGVFAGLQIGGMVSYMKTNSIENGVIQIDNLDKNVDFSSGVRAGYQQYFNPYNGLRIYATFDYSYFKNIGFDPPKFYDMFRYSAAADYLINFSNDDSPWGLFLGGGYEWLEGKKFLQWIDDMKENDGETKTNGLFVNLGLSKTFLNHNRFELGAKIRLYKIWSFKWVTDTTNQSQVFTNPVDFYLSYSYIF